MFKIMGLDEISHQLDAVQEKAVTALDGDLTLISFDPDDFASIEAAIAAMDATVDARVRPWARNSMVIDLANETKVSLHQMILDRAQRAPDTRSGA